MFLAIFSHADLCIMYSVFQLFVNRKSEVRYMWEMLWYFYGFLCREGLAPVLQFLCYFHIFSTSRGRIPYPPVHTSFPHADAKLSRTVIVHSCLVTPERG